jgi:hypothetical protein
LLEGFFAPSAVITFLVILSLHCSTGIEASQVLGLQWRLMEKKPVPPPSVPPPSLGGGNGGGISQLEIKLAQLREQLARLEGEEAEKIRIKRIEADMGDDFRENEGAKLVMDDHNLLFLRRIRLKQEILELKKQIIAAKKK